MIEFAGPEPHEPTPRSQPLQLLEPLKPYLLDGTALWVSAPIALSINERFLAACPDPAGEIEAAIKFLRAFLTTTQAKAAQAQATQAAA